MVRHVKPSDYVDAKDYVAQVEDTPLTQAVDAYLATEPGTEAALFLAARSRAIVRGQRLPRNPYRKRKLDRERRRKKVLRGECSKCNWPHLPGQTQCWHHQLLGRIRSLTRRKRCNHQPTQSQLQQSSSVSSGFLE